MISAKNVFTDTDEGKASAAKTRQNFRAAPRNDFPTRERDKIYAESLKGRFQNTFFDALNCFKP